MTSQEIVAVVRTEISRIYGKKYAEKCVIDYGKNGWFYFSHPLVGRRGRLEINPLPAPTRKYRMLEFLEELQNIEKQ